MKIGWKAKNNKQLARLPKMQNYYDSLIAQTKRHLPEWLYKDLQNVGRPQVVASDIEGPRAVNVLEKIGLHRIDKETLAELSEDEIKELIDRVNEIYKDEALRKDKVNDFSQAAVFISADLSRRDMPLDESSLALHKEETPDVTIEPKEKEKLWRKLFSKSDDDNQVTLCKIDEEKRIVTGIVHDPYIIDAHKDWIPPNEMENIAFDYMEKSRKIKDRHTDVMGKAKAAVVESWIERYPTTADYKAAIAGKPHDIYRIKHGKDFVNSGSWLMSMKIHDDQMWADIKSGKINAFSLGGEGKRKPVTRAAMPQVRKIIEIDGATAVVSAVA